MGKQTLGAIIFITVALVAGNSIGKELHDKDNLITVTTANTQSQHELQSYGFEDKLNAEAVEGNTGSRIYAKRRRRSPQKQTVRLQLRNELGKCRKVFVTGNNNAFWFAEETCGYGVSERFSKQVIVGKGVGSIMIHGQGGHVQGKREFSPESITDITVNISNRGIFTVKNASGKVLWTGR